MLPTVTRTHFINRRLCKRAIGDAALGRSREFEQHAARLRSGTGLPAGARAASVVATHRVSNEQCSFPMLAAQQRAAPKLPVPSGFSPECALAALCPCRAHTSLQARTVSQAGNMSPEFPAAPLLVAPLRDASHLCKARTGFQACTVTQADGMPSEFPASPLPARILVKMHQVPIYEMSSSLVVLY